MPNHFSPRLITEKNLCDLGCDWLFASVNGVVMRIPFPLFTGNFPLYAKGHAYLPGYLAGGLVLWIDQTDWKTIQRNPLQVYKLEALTFTVSRNC